MTIRKLVKCQMCGFFELSENVQFFAETDSLLITDGLLNFESVIVQTCQKCDRETQHKISKKLTVAPPYMLVSLITSFKIDEIPSHEIDISGLLHDGDESRSSPVFYEEFARLYKIHNIETHCILLIAARFLDSVDGSFDWLITDHERAYEIKNEELKIMLQSMDKTIDISLNIVVYKKVCLKEDCDCLEELCTPQSENEWMLNYEAPSLIIEGFPEPQPEVPKRLPCASGFFNDLIESNIHRQILIKVLLAAAVRPLKRK
ncbi:hypothetical protein ACOME3_005991 [Neoechinorhynchus agilis]